MSAGSSGGYTDSSALNPKPLELLGRALLEWCWTDGGHLAARNTAQAFNINLQVLSRE